MSGRRSLIKGFLEALRLIVGAVMSSACRCGAMAPRPWCCPLIRCPYHVGALDCADKATGFRINPLSCASPLGHPRFLCCLGFL